ncbi:hypothetical protein QN372_20940 [Undibacterium sp. RTI2.1]|uniref:hypothetical protein n=1 Tax=unclassified Undibacterium TaxID=2630295 RepID=UPI002B226630|nr:MULTISPECIES: hypothetical protein [unclassified Undibacterium]MEB0033207.1 hypothetical protein [Undibacterium sp. RTI2.1]MEB0119002.1 hypothetical protein [Undibacterium sp. RTI2.2]
MTTTFVPFTWLCKLVLRSFSDLVHMCQSSQKAKEVTTIKNVPVSSTQDRANPPSPIITPSTPPEPITTMMDLNGVEYQFTETPARVVTVSKQTYQSKLTVHPDLGRKLLPTNGLMWVNVATYKNVSTLVAIELFIKDGLSQAPEVTTVEPVKQVNTPPSLPTRFAEAAALPKPMTEPTKRRRPDVGKLIKMGDQLFPDNDKPGQSYTNFAITLDTANFGPKVIQGEGLKEALSLINAKIGDNIQVQRLEQKEVQLINKKTKEPIFDKDWKPVMKLKWQWSITAQ